MKVSGWIFLIVSWGAIVGLCVWCFRLIVGLKAEEHLVAPLEIETEPPDEAQGASDKRPVG